MYCTCRPNVTIKGRNIQKTVCHSQEKHISFKVDVMFHFLKSI